MVIVMRILSMSGFVPEQICDTIRFTGYLGRHSISHYCDYASDYISQILEDDSIDGAVYPKSCDSCRVITSYLENSGKFLHQIRVPAREDEGAAAYFAASIRAYQTELEKYFQIEIPEASIRERADMIAERNRRVRLKYDSLLEGASYFSYLSQIHRMLQQPLAEQEVEAPPPEKRARGIPIYLIGSFVGDLAVIGKMEEIGLKIVGDNITESKRLFSVKELDGRGDIYGQIARSILGNSLSPTQDDFSTVLARDMEEIRERGAKGVVFLIQKYCEAYDYLYYIYKRELDRLGIPVLRLSVSGTVNMQVRALALETFADMLQG